MLLRLEMEFREGPATSIDGRPDKRLELLVRYFFDGKAPCDSWPGSAGTVLGLGPGVRLSGSAIKIAGHGQLAYCYRFSKDNSMKPTWGMDVCNFFIEMLHGELIIAGTEKFLEDSSVIGMT